MFKDLKEYQDITRIYNESVNISEEQRAINKAIAEAGFTDEEILYLDENFDELWETELETLTEEIIAEQEQLDEMAGMVAKKVVGGVAKKVAPKVAKGVSKGAKGIGGMLKKGISAVAKKLPTGVKKAAKNVGGAMKKVGGVLKKAAPFALAGGAFEVGSRAVKSIADKGDKAKKDAELDAKIKKGIKDSGMGDKGTAITQKGREQAAYNKGERAARKKLNDPTLNLTKSEIEAKKKTDPPKATETKPKKKMHPIEKKNRARFGDAHVDKLKSKQVDFKAMRKGKMSKDDFIKKYPNSITAQKSKGLRDHAEWDAYDMVLEYLFSTEQVNTIEEANYVMMEMEQETIGSIVNDVNEFLEEGIGSVRILPALGKMALGAAAVKGISSYLGKKSGESSIKGGQQVKDKAGAGGVIKKIKDRKDATNKAIEQM